jgi:F0F1-type ATP synthase delta subunit
MALTPQELTEINRRIARRQEENVDLRQQIERAAIAGQPLRHRNQ